MISKYKTRIFIVLFILMGVSAYLIWKTEPAQKLTAQVLKKEFIPNQPPDIEKTHSYIQKDSIYTDFRTRCPFHFQTLALAKLEDESYLFLLSEPAPYVIGDSVLALFQSFNVYSEIKTHPLGYDGWVKDMVICVGKATSENIQNLSLKLNRLLYDSDYKSFTLPLPLDTSRVFFSTANLNYRISLQEIKQWFLEEAEVFIDLADTTQSFSIPTLCKEQKSGVFYSRQPGFVIWCIDKKKDMQQQKEWIRPFTLDADLILGAVSDSNILVIIGRERESGIMELPPLQVETILLLASIKEDELSQSLDINDLLAGKMANDKDWCPTYLSPQLENTEFGHLLTITDVLLKDWSENGTLQYEDYAYPKPPYYPFDRPLFAKLGLNELVYNWNTANTMFAYEENGINLYALNRTGSLPVSYFNSQANWISAGQGYENTAYLYFSGLCNTDLIRVVQYTSLYQLFMDNHVVYAGDTLHYAPKNKPYLLFGNVNKLLNRIRDLDAKELESLSNQIALSNFQKYQHHRLMKEIKDWEQNYGQPLPDERREEVIRDAQTYSQNILRNQIRTLQQRLSALDETTYKHLCLYLSYPRGNRISNEAKQKIYRLASDIYYTVFSIGKANLRYFGADLSSIKNFYSASLKNSSSPWVKTPSLMISYNSARLTGGHNLSSKIKKVNSIQADKAIVNSARPQAVLKETSGQPAQKPLASSGKPKAKNAVQPIANPKPTVSTPNPVRKRSEVIATTARKKRGF